MSKKKNKSKKTKNLVTFAFFNKHEIESFDMTFEKIRLAAFNAIYRKNLPYKQWPTVEKMKENLQRVWNYEFDEKGVKFYFRRWWLDQVVKELSTHIWCEVNRMHLNTWFQTKYLPTTDLPRKLKNNPEAVSSYLADTAEKEFYSCFY